MIDRPHPGGVVYIGLDEWVEIATLVLGLDEATVRGVVHLDLADSALHAPQAGFGDTDVYSTLVAKAAVLGMRLALNHPLPDGNKRTAFITMIEFLESNGAVWELPDTDDAVATMLAVAAGELDLDTFTVWVAGHVTIPDT